MRLLIQRIRQRGTACRSLVVLALLALVPACDSDDPLPTGPPATALAPLAAVLGAESIGLGFDAVAINEAGQVAGTLDGHAVLWTPGGGIRDLGTLGGPSSRAYAINASGQVAGASATATGDTHAFLWTPNDGMLDLGTLGGGRASMAYGINDHGEVVGENIVPPTEPFFRPVHQAFRWTMDTGMQSLGSLSQSLNSSIAFDINNVGQVVGRGYASDRDILPPTDPLSFSHAFLWTPGQGMRDLGGGVAYAINDAGTVVGGTFGVTGGAFRWTAGDGWQNLGAFGPAGDSSAALGINEAGEIVGWSTVGLSWFYGIRAFIWTTSEGLENLTPTTGISRARAINNHRQVVGDGRVATMHLGPGNVPPVARPGGPYTGNEGYVVQFGMSGTDLDGGELWGRVDYGDGYSDFFDVMLPFTYPERTGKHVYADNDTYSLRLIVSDARGGKDTAATTVTIANVAPTILAGSLTAPAAPIQLTGGTASVPIAFEFRDPAAQNDVYAAEVACGNGVVLTATNIPVSSTVTNGVYVGTGTYTGTCPYTSAGVYTVRVIVSDEDGGTSAPASYRYVIVYDPAGSFTTGSGFYDVPGQGKRKAHFVFDAGFPLGGTVPNGTMRLWVPGGDVNFESTRIEMLVVSGNRAQFWGTGTLNGAAARFRITAVEEPADGHQGAADAIRVELWDTSGTALLYDTQPGAAQDAAVTTPLGGGNIRIRAG